jgi:ribosomal protein L30
MEAQRRQDYHHAALLRLGGIGQQVQHELIQTKKLSMRQYSWTSFLLASSLSDSLHCKTGEPANYSLENQRSALDRVPPIRAVANVSLNCLPVLSVHRLGCLMATQPDVVRSLFVTLRRGMAGKPWFHRRVIEALGLKRRHQCLEKPNNESIRGMLKKVNLQSVVLSVVPAAEPQLLHTLTCCAG